MLNNYRDMQLLHEVAQNPRLTQRDLGKLIGAALGLTNLRLHDLCSKGFIKIIGEEKNRHRYLITSQGIKEKNRLISEYLEASLRYYCRLRRFLRNHFETWAEQGCSKVLLFGSSEVAEVAYLTMQEVGLELAGVVGDRDQKEIFFNLPVQRAESIPSIDFDRVIVASMATEEQDVQTLLNLGVPSCKIMKLPEDEMLLVRGVREWRVPSSARLPAETNSPQRAVASRSRKSKSEKSILPPAVLPSSRSTDVVVLCGGRGTRLDPLTRATPKPLLPVEGEPFLLRLLLQLKHEGFSRFILAAHYLSDQFRSFLATYEAQLPEVELVVEPEPLGTGGAIRYALERVRSSSFVVLNGDSWVQQPLVPVLRDHLEQSRNFTVIAVEAARVEGEALTKGVWRVGPQGEVLGFDTLENVREGWVNAGCYVLDRTMVASWPFGSYSLESNLHVLLNARTAGVFCSSGRLLDIGTPAIYGRAPEILKSFESADIGVLR